MDEDFLKQLKKDIDQYQLIQKNEKVLIGVSGGPDSVALLLGLHFLSEVDRMNWRLFVVHVNHLLRGDESQEDARFVAELCTQKKIPYRICEADVQKQIDEKGGNIQSTARVLRYQAFYDTALDWGIKKVALAHHADDQVETVLMNVIRGTSVSGLKGMERRRSWKGLQIIRPMIHIFRKDIEIYLQRKTSVIPRYDSSNESTDYTRNRIRHFLLPQLISYNPKVKNALLNLAEIARSEEEIWQSLTEQAMKSVVIQKSSADYWLDVKKFLDLPVALQRRTVKLILDCLIRNGRNEISLDTIEKVRGVFTHPHPSAEWHVAGGMMVKKEYDNLHITLSKEREVRKIPLVKLKIPGITRLPDYNGVMEVTLKDKSITPTNYHHQKAVFDADLINRPLYVRPRKSGDRMTCFGLNGSKKIKDLFIEAKIPKWKRDRYPIVVMDNQIIWVPGVRRSDFAPVTDQTKRILSFVWRENQL